MVRYAAAFFGGNVFVPSTASAATQIFESLPFRVSSRSIFGYELQPEIIPSVITLIEIIETWEIFILNAQHRAKRQFLSCDSVEYFYAQNHNTATEKRCSEAKRNGPVTTY